MKKLLYGFVLLSIFLGMLLLKHNQQQKAFYYSTDSLLVGQTYCNCMALYKDFRKCDTITSNQHYFYALVLSKKQTLNHDTLSIIDGLYGKVYTYVMTNCTYGLLDGNK